MMKKTFFTLALGLLLVLAGCSKDEKDLRSELAGNYEVDVIIGMVPVEAPTTLTLTKHGDGFKAATTVALPEIPGLPGYINISLLLSSLKEVSELEDGISGKGYFFKIAEQPIAVGGRTFYCAGLHDLNIDEEEEDYDGVVTTYSFGSHSGKAIAFSIEIMLEDDIPLYIMVISRDVPALEATIGGGGSAE